MAERRTRDWTTSQLGQEGSSVSHGSACATKTLHRLHSSSSELDGLPVSERHNVNHQALTQHNAIARPASLSRPSSAAGQRPPSAAGRRRRAVRHNVSGSYVDESLFGPVEDTTSTSPWQPKQRPVKPFIFDCTDYKAKAANSANVPSTRPSGQRSARSRPQSARLHSQPSFVDESLFGDRLELSTWRAPWDKKDRRPKPLIFDATNYREKQQRADSRSASTKQLPPWR